MKPKLQRFRVTETSGTVWGHYRTTVRETVIPYQWRALNDEIADAEPSHAIRNFRIAAGLEQGTFHGMVFQDSDVGKWIEAVAYSLRDSPSGALERRVDETVAILKKAQHPDGYLNTYFTLKEPGRRWTNLRECHELYCAGHLLEGAIAYFQATGKPAFLDLMVQYVELIERTFGPRPGQIRGYDGHEEIELALLRLYELSREPRHLDLARFFLEERGQEPSFFQQEWETLNGISHWNGTRQSFDPEYYQSHLPVRQQTLATGHAVRAVYLYTAMAHLASAAGDEALTDVCRQLWNNIVHRQMYVTGGIGSTHLGEAFTFDYDLPNATAYAETCAAIGLVFLGRRLLETRSDSTVADVQEMALYNAILASMSLDGQRFFYVNPLEVDPEASRKNPDRHHVKAQRQAWFSCACCPPNLARLVMSLGDYVLSQRDNRIDLHHFVPGCIRIGEDGREARLEVETDYPVSGKVLIRLFGNLPESFVLRVRRPGWCRHGSASRDGMAIDLQAEGDGYLTFRGPWAATTTLKLDWQMKPEFLVANPKVRAAAGRLALRRGPLLYCFEEADNGPLLSSLVVDAGSEIVVGNPRFPTLGAPALLVRGWSEKVQTWGEDLYQPHQGADTSSAATSLTAVPYMSWGNRSTGEMSVWLRSNP